MPVKHCVQGLCGSAHTRINTKTIVNCPVPCPLHSAGKRLAGSCMGRAAARRTRSVSNG